MKKVAVRTYCSPPTREHDIGTYFNRAVVSPQAFAKEFGSQELDDEMLARG